MQSRYEQYGAVVRSGFLASNRLNSLAQNGTIVYQNRDGLFQVRKGGNCTKAYFPDR